MIPTTRRGTLSFTPEPERGKPDAPIYYYGIPSGVGRAARDRAILAAGARFWTRLDFMVEAEKAIAAAEPDNMDALLAVVAAAKAVPMDEDLDADLAHQWGAIAEELRRTGGIIAAMLADNSYYLEIAPLVTVAHFVKGWDNVPVSLRRLKDGTVDLDCLDELDPMHVILLYNEIFRQAALSNAQRKNSASLPPSPSDQENSSVASDLPTAALGTSAETSTSATPD